MPISITSAPALGKALTIASEVADVGIAGHDESDERGAPLGAQGGKTAVDAGRHARLVSTPAREREIAKGLDIARRRRDNARDVVGPLPLTQRTPISLLRRSASRRPRPQRRGERRDAACPRYAGPACGAERRPADALRQGAQRQRGLSARLSGMDFRRRQDRHRFRRRARAHAQGGRRSTAADRHQFGRRLGRGRDGDGPPDPRQAPGGGRRPHHARALPEGRQDLRRSEGRRRLARRLLRLGLHLGARRRRRALRQPAVLYRRPSDDRDHQARRRSRSSTRFAISSSPASNWSCRAISSASRSRPPPPSSSPTIRSTTTSPTISPRWASPIR